MHQHVPRRRQFDIGYSPTSRQPYNGASPARLFVALFRDHGPLRRFAGGRLHRADGDVLGFANGIRQVPHDLFDRADTVVVARNRQVDHVRIAIGIDQGDRGDTKGASFTNRVLFLLRIDERLRHHRRAPFSDSRYRHLQGSAERRPRDGQHRAEFAAPFELYNLFLLYGDCPQTASDMRGRAKIALLLPSNRPGSNERATRCAPSHRPRFPPGRGSPPAAAHPSRGAAASVPSPRPRGWRASP